MFKTIRFLMLQHKVHRMERKLIRISRKRQELLDRQQAYSARVERMKEKLKCCTDVMVRPDGVKSK